jgi:hypothetical protein
MPKLLVAAPPRLASMQTAFRLMGFVLMQTTVSLLVSMLMLGSKAHAVLGLTRDYRRAKEIRLWLAMLRSSDAGVKEIAATMASELEEEADKGSDTDLATQHVLHAAKRASRLSDAGSWLGLDGPDVARNASQSSLGPKTSMVTPVPQLPLH